MIALARYNKAVDITTSDTVDLTPSGKGTGQSAQLTDGIYIGGNGNIVVVWEDGSTTTFNGVTAGTILPVRCRRVNFTNTTAANLRALYQI